jgi:hypothetical protein
MELDSRVARRRQVVVQRGEEAHDVRRAAGDGVPAVAALAVARLQRVHVEERPAVEREARQEAVVERPLEQVGEAALARHEEQPPVPHDVGDRCAGLAVGAVRRQLIRLANRLAVMARADSAGQVRLGRDDVVPLVENRRQQLLVAALRVEIRNPRGEVERAHGVAAHSAGPANGLGVLVVREIEAAAREHPVTAPRGERLRQLEVAPAARVPVELDEGDLDLGMSVGALLRPVAEDIVDQVGEATGDREEGRVARRPIERDAGLDQVTSAVEFVAHLEIGPTPYGVDELAPRVQVAVGLLSRADEVDRLARERLELRRRLPPELPGDRLEPLVDVGVAEHHPPPLALDTPGGDAEVVERPGALEFLGTEKKRELPVHPLAVREQPAQDPHLGRVERPEPDARDRGRRHAPEPLLDRLHYPVSLLHGVR